MSHRSRLRRRNRRGNPPEWGDWIVGGTALNAAGAPSALSSWGSSGGTVLTSGSSMSYVLTGEQLNLVGAAAVTGPGISELKIEEIQGSLFFTMNSANTKSANFFVAIGIYVAELNSSSSAWSTRDPMTTTDAGRDDYLFIRGINFAAGLTSLESDVDQPVEVRLAIPAPEVIGAGEALVVTVSQIEAISGGSLNVLPFVRSRVTLVA